MIYTFVCKTSKTRRIALEFSQNPPESQPNKIPKKIWKTTKFEISIFLPPFYLSCFFFAESHHDLTQPTSTLHGGEIFFFILFSFMTTAKLHGVVFQFPCPKLPPNFKLRSVKNFAAEIDPIYQFCGCFNLWEHYRFSALFTFFSPFWLFFRNFTFSLLST